MELSINDAIRVLLNEGECLKRTEVNMCERTCAECDLYLPREMIYSAYMKAIDVLDEAAKKGE